MTAFKKTRLTSRSFAMLLMAIVWSGCSSVQSTLETAQFHLDQGEYTKAIALLEPVVEDDNTNFKAVSLLASAYTSRGLLGEDDPDTEANEGGSFLSAFSNYLEGQQPGKSNMESLEAASPSAAGEGKSDLFRAEDLLDLIATANLTQENHLQYGVTHLGVISAVGVHEVGAADTNDPCELDFSQISAEEDARYTRALDEINDNFTEAGISDWETTALGELLGEMDSDRDAAGDTVTFLEAEYGTGSCP